MNIIKKCILILIILIIVIIIILAVLINNKEESNSNAITIEESFNKANKITKIENKNEWFNVQYCLNMYSRYSDNLRIAEMELNDKNLNQQEKEYNERQKEQLVNIIPDFVIEKMNITQENIYEKIAIKEQEVRINSIYKSIQTVSKVAYEESTSINAYLVTGVLINKNDFTKQEFKIIVLIDNINNTFLIIPNQYIEEENINLSVNQNVQLYDEEQIEKNNYNTFIEKAVSTEDICRKYFADFKINLTYDIQFAYECLDKDYKEKRFGNFENFEKYIQDNSREINHAVFSSYMVNNYEDYTEYVCRDQYKNLYIFKETALMEFTLTLDTYTLPNEKFTTTYEISDNHMKVMMNIDKWIQMLNNRDYKAAYNVLDETFRQNNFGSVEKFEEYMRQNLPLHYDVKFTDFSDQGQNYVQDIELTDITKENTEVLTKSIVMKLGEETDFVMSFKIQ